MLFTARAYTGMVVTPHRLASEAGLAILRKGGNAVEAAVAAAATLCVVYPHMTGLGGDAFWLIHSPAFSSADGPTAIDASGRSSLLASQDWYAQSNCSALPKRGPLAALTMAGAVSGWERALDISARLSGEAGRPSLGLADLFAAAIALAEKGFPVSDMQSAMTAAALAEMAGLPGFSQFLINGRPPQPGERLALPALARTLARLSTDGLDSFYRGPLAEALAEDLAEAGSPLRFDDFQQHRAETPAPLRLRLAGATLYNMPPPTQGVSSLTILGLLERFAGRTGCDLSDEGTLVHAIVEATKQAFSVRDAYVADPQAMERSAQSLLEPQLLDALANDMRPDRAAPWPAPLLPGGGDTVWFGVMDAWGNAVSCIQSIYHEFGSGLVLPRSGVTWHNRGLGFTFSPGTANSLAPGKKPFHTLNPAMAALDDGRFIAYGTMGGEGQPQTQAAVYARAITLGLPLQDAVTAPRWLLGRAWGDASDSLKLEASFPAGVLERLKALGHIIETLPAFSSLVGHAGALVRHPDGLLEGAFDPRSDGSAACC